MLVSYPLSVAEQLFDNTIGICVSQSRFASMNSTSDLLLTQVMLQFQNCNQKIGLMLIFMIC